MNLADVPPHKELLSEFIETMKLELEDLGVEVRLNTPGSAAVCREIGADSVFLATGGTPSVPPLPGIEKAVNSTDILTGAVKAQGKKIAVIGGGVTGLETAEYLSGSNSVTVVEMLGEVGTLLYASAKKLLLKRLADKGALIRTETALAGVGDGCASFKDKDGNVTEEPFDLVVLAMGVRSDRSLRESLEAEGLRVILTGDCEKPGQIREALHSSYDRAFFF
jgi:pyruvate/2-oxoglutarate dehydrogenase complex dihydrolipoamide dehydrogenase (E3) component